MNIENRLDIDIEQCSTIAISGGKLLVIRPTFYDKYKLIAGIINSINRRVLVICSNKNEENRIRHIVNSDVVQYTTYRKLSFNDVKINGQIE